MTHEGTGERTKMVGVGRNPLKGGRVVAAGCWLVFLSLLSLVSLSSDSSHAADPPNYRFVESFGPDGSSATNFEHAASAAVDQESDLVYVLDKGAGILYKFDSDGSPVGWGGSAPYIAGNAISGLTFPPSAVVEFQVAVDSISHKVFVVDANSLRGFLPNGEPAEFTAGPGIGTSSIGGFSQIGGIATDAEGYIYASDKEAGVVKIFAPSGELVKEFAAANAANLAVDGAGAVYVSRRTPSDLSAHTVLKFTPSAALPVTGATTYSPASQPVDPEVSFGVAVDPATNDVYISKGLNPGIHVYDESGEFIASFGQPGSEGELSSVFGLAVAGGTTKVYVPNKASGGVSQVKVFELEPPPPPAPPTVEDLSVSEVGNSAATLRAQINPNSVNTTYHFEYGLKDCAVSACASVPLSPAGIGAGHDVVTVSNGIGNLLAATTYHYRVVAENSLGADERSGVFRTEGSGLGFQLVDRRAWEMVSPSDKHGALILPGLGLDEGQVQAAANGTGLAYVTRNSIGENPAGNRSLERSSALARRGPGGVWSSEDIEPPNSRVIPIALGQQSVYKLFSADLSEALLEPRDGIVLSPEASQRTPYWRQNGEPPAYRPLVTGKEGFANVPADIEFGGNAGGAVPKVAIRTATPDLDHVVLYSAVGLAHGDPINTSYIWFDGKLEPLGVLPDAEGGEIIQSSAGSADHSMRHAISGDGARVFWTSGFPEQWSPGFSRHLYVRDTVADETVRLDVPSDGSGVGPSEPLFQGASADGNVVFFTGRAQLTADASPSGADLYRCGLPLSAPLAGCASLVNISAPLLGSGESAEVLGVAPVLSEDGTVVYFVARGKLDTEANQANDVAISGAPNLYVWREGEGVRFIARLSEKDEANWGFAQGQKGPRVAFLSAVGSPSGRYLAFMSERSLSGEDHLNAAGEPVEQVFRYDALADRFDCISCHPTGAKSEGAVVSPEERPLIDPRAQWLERLVAAVVPQSPIIGTTDATIPLHRTRSVHDNGRIYFNAVNALVPADSNGQWDVYQYEPSGTGTCASSMADADTSATAGGCVSLISSGTADGPTGFIDASVGGGDVFIFTPARLSVLDQDDENDIYDARVDGIQATLVPPVECLGEACQAPPVVPNDPTPAGSTFQGPGNLKPKPAKRCAKGKRKVKRQGQVRCVPRKNRKSQDRKPRAGEDRRAAR